MERSECVKTEVMKFCFGLNSFLNSERRHEIADAQGNALEQVA